MPSSRKKQDIKRDNRDKTHNQINQEDELQDSQDDIKDQGFNFEGTNSNELGQGNSFIDSDHLPFESIRLTENNTKEINQKVHYLLSSLKEFKKSFQKAQKSYSNFDSFYEANKDDFQELLNYQLDKLYDESTRYFDKYQKLLEQLNSQEIITLAEKAIFTDQNQKVEYQKIVKSILSKNEDNKDLTKLTEEDINQLNNTDTENYQDLLNRLSTENKLKASQVNMLKSAFPKKVEDIGHEKEQILTKISRYDAVNSTDYLNNLNELNKHIKSLDQELNNYINRYNQFVEKLVTQIASVAEDEENKQLRKEALEKTSKQLGLPLKKGTVFWMSDPNQYQVDSHQNLPKNIKVEIVDITHSAEEIIYDGPSQYKRKIPSLEPVLVLKLTSPSNEVVTYNLSASRFTNWAEENDLSLAFENEEQLASHLGVNGFLKAGQTFEYELPYKITDDPSKKVTKTVKIEKIENGIIFLDQDVVLDYKPKSKRSLHNTGFTNKLTLSEFHKWYNKFKTVPDFKSLGELDNALEQQHQVLCEEKGWPKDEVKPIKFSGAKFPFPIISADKPIELPVLYVKEASPNKITFTDNNSLTPNQFYRLVRDQNLTNPNEKQLKELKEQAEKEKNKNKVNEMDQALKVVNPTTTDNKEKEHKFKKPSYFQDLWNNTNFLSLMEMYGLFFKAPKEKIASWLKDRSETKEATVGSQFYKGFPKFGGLNGLSDEFAGKLGSKLVKEVKDLQDFLENNHKSDEIQNILYETAEMSNTAEASKTFQAAIAILAKKGKLRWEDDSRLIAAVNRLNSSGTITYPEKFKETLNDTVVVVGDKSAMDKEPTLSIYDQYRAIIDGLYGAGMFDTWSGQNESEYMKQREEAGKNMRSKYEFLQGGINHQLKKMLYDWESGRDINAAEFEGLLVNAIKELEVNMEQGMMFFISAFSVKNKNGQTLLPFSRLNHFVSDLRNLQVYAYFAAAHNVLDENGNKVMIQDSNGNATPKTGKFGLNNFKELFNRVVQQDINASEKKGLEKYTAGKNTINWIQSEVLTSPTLKRQATNKAGNPDLDPNLYHYLGPLVWQENDLDKILSTRFGSSAKLDTVKNMYVGYNNQLILRANKLETADNKEANLELSKDFGQMVYSFIYFNNIVRSRINKKNYYLRLGEAQLDDKPNVDKKRSVRSFALEVEQFIKEITQDIINLSGNKKLAGLAGEVLVSGETEIDGKKEKVFREELLLTINKLAITKPQQFASLMKSRRSSLTGMSGAQMSWEEQQKLKQAA